MQVSCHLAGLRGLYHGTSATLLRDVPFSILFFPGYANMKKFTADSNGGSYDSIVLMLALKTFISGFVVHGLSTYLADFEMRIVITAYAAR
jgi:hypothetical protein